MRRLLHLLSLWLLLGPAAVFAGHGFVTAFANIEGLPAPDRTPDSTWYALETWQEESQLFLERDAEARVLLCLTFAREKLAEVEAMVNAEQVSAAEHAAHRYRSYVNRVQQFASEHSDEAVRASIAETVANALLEHQYILSVIYEELPVKSRGVVLQVIATAQEQYQEIARLVPVKKKRLLAAKESEVLWSVQTATKQ